MTGKKAPNTMETKWGHCRLNGRYYTVYLGNRKEKVLHRLIWEEFYGCEVPEGYVIHHRDHNPLNNCIMNLQLMRASEHSSMHNKGKTFKHSDEAKRKISESKIDKPRSEETKRKISKAMSGKNNPNWKNHGTIYKKSKNNYGKTVYALRFKGKVIKRSIDKQKLIDFFLKNYPLEILEVHNYDEV